MTENAIVTMLEAEYHRDPCPAPSLSASTLRTFLSQSPLHAWRKHPKLGGAPEEHRELWDLGTAGHALILEKNEDRFVIVEADSWRTKDAKSQRDQAWDDGLIPILEEKYENVLRMVKGFERAKSRFTDTPPLMDAGKPEQTLIWQEDGIWLRARLDWLRDDHAGIDDLKTTGSANPHAWIRTHLFRMGFDIQSAFYQRGLRAITGSVDYAAFRFALIENEAPFAGSVVSLDPEAMFHAHDKVEQGIQRWRACLESNKWPGYPTETCYAEAPAWDLAQWAERDGD